MIAQALRRHGHEADGAVITSLAGRPYRQLGSRVAKWLLVSSGSRRTWRALLAREPRKPMDDRSVLACRRRPSHLGYRHHKFSQGRLLSPTMAFPDISIYFAATISRRFTLSRLLFHHGIMISPRLDFHDCMSSVMLDIYQ